MGYFRNNVAKAEGYTPGLQPRQADVTKLNTNENPYPPSPAVAEAIQALDPEQLRRYPDPTASEFRQAAAEVHGASPENIICCNGGDDLLSITLRACCNGKRAVAYPVPTYSLYPVLANLQDCRKIELPFDGEYNLPAKLSSTGAALTILCNPNAPSGSFINTTESASLADEIKGVLLVDEAYVDFAQDNCLRLIENFDNLIILRSMSKGYSLAGVRFGYGIAQSSLIEGLNKVRDSYAVDVVAIAAATAAIKDQAHFKKNVAAIKQERARLTEKLRAMGLIVPDSFANFVLADAKSYKAKDIYDKLAKRNIYVRYFDLPGLDNKLRISDGTKDQNNLLLNALNEILSK